MSSDVVTYESANRVATITINRPDKLNALSEGVVQGLNAAWKRYNDSDDRCAIVTGAGDRAFSVGADLREPPARLWEGMPGVGVIVDKPIIAAVSGHCVGGAYVLVQLCDLAVATGNANFFYPEAQLGFCGGLIAGAATRLPQKIAMEFMLTGKRFDAQRAYEVGMINKVVPDGDQISGAMEYAEILVDSAPLVVGMLKRFVRDTVIPRSPSELSALAQTDLLAIQNSEDQKEGGTSFREKRKPVFQGR